VHGYQIMQSMSDRAGAAWHLSRGTIYRTIAQLEDKGLVMTREEGGRRLVTVTSEGRAQVDEGSAGLGDLFAGFADGPGRADPRDLWRRVHVAVCQIEVGGDAIQLEGAANGSLLARRSLYLILAAEAVDLGQ
jgi:DNA-binding transcriptional ArsR family regulator